MPRQTPPTLAFTPSPRQQPVNLSSCFLPKLYATHQFSRQAPLPSPAPKAPLQPQHYSKQSSSLYSSPRPSPSQPMWPPAPSRSPGAPGCTPITLTLLSLHHVNDFPPLRHFPSLLRLNSLQLLLATLTQIF